ncbi:MAG: hypothetical protein PUF65_02865 [Lachnospiraceae bacterium]|nr:hypothetical protein [Lachnospiraceae bacterium]
MNYKRPFILEILAEFHSLLLFAVLYPFLASVFLLKGTTFWRATFCSLFLLPALVISRILIQRLRNFLLFLFSGVLVAALTGFFSFVTVGLHHPAGKVYCFLSVFFTMMIFIIRAYTKVSYGQMKQEFYAAHGDKAVFTVQEWEVTDLLTSPRPYHWVWYTVLYVAGMFFHFKTFLYIAFTMLFADILICAAFYYMNALHTYIHKNRHVASLPVQTMKKSHRMIGILGALLFVLFLLPSALYGREFLPNLKAEKPTLTFMEVMHSTQEPSDPEISSEQIAAAIIAQQDTPAWVFLLIRILCFLVIVAIVVTAIVLLVRYIQRTGQSFSVEAEDETVFLNAGQTDSADTVAHPDSTDAHPSAEQQIRKRYRKTIKKATKGQPNSWATPSELEQDAGLSEQEKTQTLHDIYEKARYSQDGCTSDDWNLLR